MFLMKAGDRVLVFQFKLYNLNIMLFSNSKLRSDYSLAHFISYYRELFEELERRSTKHSLVQKLMVLMKAGDRVLVISR